MPSQVIESRGRLITLPVRPNVKGARGLYPLADPEELAIEEKYNSITKPLTLLTEFGDRKPQTVIARSDGRPNTPVHRVVTFIPKTLDDLNNVVRKRICPNEVLPLPVADQQCLAAIILGEVSTQWEDLRSMPENPLLNKEENRELTRRVFIHVVTVCEELFFHYNAKLELLSKSGVFTGPANIARLRGQLALDADKFLNVGYIRRRIAREMVNGVTTTDQVAGAGPKLNLTQDELFDKSRPDKPKTVITIAHREIKDMMARMPDDLDLEKVTDLLPEGVMVMDAAGGHSTPRTVRQEMSGDKMTTQVGTTELDSKNTRVRLTRSKSHEDFRWDIDRFEDEIGDFKPKPALIDVHENAIYHLRRSQLPRDRVYTPPVSPRRDAEKHSGPVEIDQNFIRDDLEKRSKYVPLKDLNENVPEDEELPPLLQASSKYNHVEGRLEMLQTKLKELEQKEKDELERQRRELYENATSSEPRHPQPAVISTKFPNFMVVRTNDVRVSDRVSLNSLTLQSYPPIFNHLNNEIHMDCVRKLDARLFYLKDLTDVYEDLMSSAPGDHLNLELDPEIEQSGSDMRLSECLPSKSLLKRPSERIVNQDLLPAAEGLEPPWAAVGDVDDWRRTVDAPVKGSHQMLVKALRNKDTGVNYVDADEGVAKENNAWLTWWRSVVDQEDYLKFLSTVETDYLALRFHMYREEDELALEGASKGDSDSEDEYLRNPTDSVLQMLPPKSREKNSKLIAAVKEKEQYVEGFWNARSVNIGGLGKLPSQQEVETLSRLDENDKGGEVANGESMSKEQQTTTVHKLTLALVEGKDKLNILKEQKMERIRRKAAGASLQDRLEKVWNDLKVPDQLRLDMALKYSGEPWITKISSAVAGWEKCAVGILARENILAKLEMFETHASDPDRFFKKGHAGSSKLRLKESKIRQEFDESLKIVDVRIRKHCGYVEETFKDVVTYQGRPYLQKMKFDRTEMLYWLQQERRERGLEREILSQKFPLKGLAREKSNSTPRKAISPVILEPIM